MSLNLTGHHIFNGTVQELEQLMQESGLSFSYQRDGFSGVLYFSCYGDLPNDERIQEII